MPFVFAQALDVVIEEVSGIGGAVGPDEFPLAVLLAVIVLADEFRLIRPNFCALAVLLVFDPLSFVDCSVSVVEFSEPPGSVFLPVSFVAVSVRVNQPALALGLVVLPVSDVVAPILPDLFPFPVSLAQFPLSLVDAIILQHPEWGKLRAVFEFLCVWLLGNVFSELFDGRQDHGVCDPWPLQDLFANLGRGCILALLLLNLFYFLPGFRSPVPGLYLGGTLVVQFLLFLLVADAVVGC